MLVPSRANSPHSRAELLDIQAIDRPDEAYDVVLCSHVIEHVADDRNALRELLRIVSRRGFLILAFPRAEEGRFDRRLGLCRSRPGIFTIEVMAATSTPSCRGWRSLRSGLTDADPVTGDCKRFNILSKSNAWSRKNPRPRSGREASQRATLKVLAMRSSWLLTALGAGAGLWPGLRSSRPA